MQEKGRRRFRVSAGVILFLAAFMMAGCSMADRQKAGGEEQKTQEQHNSIRGNETQENINEEDSTIGDSGAETVKNGDYVAKENSEKEAPLRDNDAIYADDDEDSVVTMYLTVREGNEADNTNHTWTEINSHSNYYYEENNLERFNCEAILQVGDENGPLEGEFGYGESIPNAAVQVRGQTSSKLKQKNYKIRIKEGKGSWRGQRTVALNKHGNDPVRFRNKLAYDLMKKIPQLISARTQFVHLYVKDETEGGNGTFIDYGLYTQVEQINRTYLKNHGLDNRGHLYKVNFFEWYKYEALMKLETDADYNKKEFESYLEIKGNSDHTKLQKVLEDINDYTIPIEDVIDENFDAENICYWIAFHLLIGNYDVASRNIYIYSPLNSEKWYFISWDNDASFSRTYHELKNYVQGQSWEKGLTQFTYVILFNRMFREDKYRQQLSKAFADIKQNYLTEESLKQKIQTYADVVKPYLYSEPDEEYTRLTGQEFSSITKAMASEIDVNYQYYLESLKKPWPFFVGMPKVMDGKLEVLWDVSYDIDQEDITYSFILASDNKFENILVEKDGIRIPQMEFDMLPPGEYFIRVRAKNESGYEQDCYDYLSTDDGKIYGAKSFTIHEDGSITEYEDTEGEEAEAIDEVEEE